MHIHPSLEGISQIQQLATRRELFTTAELLDVTLQIAAQTDLWQPLIRHTAEARWYEALALSDALELWLIGWTPGQATPVHDHGGAVGALTVATGRLVETAHADPSLARPRRITHDQGTRAHFSPHHIHRVANEGDVNATSIHAYSPAGLEMRLYDGEGEPQLVAAGIAGRTGALTATGS
jgi:predicted metal-dependent enzyme (double-stranded beta helix superfamily)